MKKIKVYDKKSGFLCFILTTFSKQVHEKMLKEFKKNKRLDVVEECDS